MHQLRIRSPQLHSSRYQKTFYIYFLNESMHLRKTASMAGGLNPSLITRAVPNEAAAHAPSSPI